MAMNDIEANLPAQPLEEKREDDVNWNNQTSVGSDEDDSHEQQGALERCLSSFQSCTGNQLRLLKLNPQLLFVGAFVFSVICGAGILVSFVRNQTKQDETRNAAMSIAQASINWFSGQLDLALFPLLSMAQLAAEVDAFAELPAKIGQPDQTEGALPFIEKENNEPPSHRNVTGVCDQPDLIARFERIAQSVKTNAKMEGVLANVQLAPEGVVCLVYPLNNTEDFRDGVFLDNTGALGTDLLNDPARVQAARPALIGREIGIVGPRPLRQCPDCGQFLIARLPVITDRNQIIIEGESYDRWGFANALINWEALIEKSNVHEDFEARGYEFRLFRRDQVYDETANEVTENVVVLAESKEFGMQSHYKSVSTSLQTINGEWFITVQYDDSEHHKWWTVGIVLSVVAGVGIATLVYIVLLQKQVHTLMLGKTMAQEAKVELERKMTAYFAHELRNPLSVVDNACLSMPEDLSDDAKELVKSMQLCSAFMSSIMNNLLDARKIEEGKMQLQSHPMSLKRFTEEVYKMGAPSIRAGVDFKIITNTEGQDWVLGDAHRLQQAMVNVMTNAIKYTATGSLTLTVGWEREYVKFECIDTGPGIPKDEQELIFERFHMRGGAPGSGLGLAIAKQLVDLMHGSIYFVSDPDVKPGTTCVIKVPLTPCKEPIEQISNNTEGPLDEPLSILVVDDVKMNRMMLKRRLQKSIAPNCTFTEAASGEQAVSICENESFDVIILDQYMVEAGGIMLGTETTKILREMGVDSVIIGSSGNDLRAAFHDAGADLVWQKPMPSNSEVIQQLKDALALKTKG